MALFIIFIIVIGFIVFTKPIRIVDAKLVEHLNGSTYAGKDVANELFPKIRKNYIAVPLILIVGTLLIAVLSSLKQDPNYPYQ